MHIIHQGKVNCFILVCINNKVVENCKEEVDVQKEVPRV